VVHFSTGLDADHVAQTQAAWRVRQRLMHVDPQIVRLATPVSRVQCSAKRSPGLSGRCARAGRRLSGTNGSQSLWTAAIHWRREARRMLGR
jgi:hypothetical protein